MKKTFLLFFCSAYPVCCFLFFTSCQKNSSSPSGGTQDGAQLTASANADAEAEATFNDATDNVIGVNDDAGIGTGVGVFGRSLTGKDDSISTHCFKLSISPETIGVFPKTITIDFGNGCTGPDGRTRRGKITTIYSAPMRLPGSTATTTFDEYYVDDVHVEGAMTVQNNSVNNDLVFSTTVENGKLSKPDGDYIFYNKTKTWTRISGNDTPINITDDVYSISGKKQWYSATWRYSSTMDCADYRPADKKIYMPLDCKRHYTNNKKQPYRYS